MQVNPGLGIPIGAYYAYVATWPVGAGTAAFTYAIFNMIWPPTPLRSAIPTRSPSLSDDGKELDNEKEAGVSQVYPA
jgi:hypothetical protein